MGPTAVRRKRLTQGGGAGCRERTVGSGPSLAHPAVPNTARPLSLHSTRLHDVGKQGDPVSLTKIKQNDRAQQEKNHSETRMRRC